MMDESAFGDNRRAILQLYENFLTQEVTIFLAVVVAVLTEVEFTTTLSGWWRLLIPLLLIPTIAYGIDRVYAVLYWNRRVQYVMKTEVLQIPDGKNSLKFLDLFYWNEQMKNEGENWWAKRRIRSKVGDNSLEYLTRPVNEAAHTITEKKG